LSGRQDGREAIHGGCRAGAIMHPLGKNPQSPYLLSVYMLSAGLVLPSGGLPKPYRNSRKTKSRPKAALMRAGGSYITRLGAA
jgi:hypothetical protein